MSTADRSPQQTLSQMLAAPWTAQAIYVAAKLGLADLLAEGPRDAAHLAKATGTHERSLFRLLRALASVGIFAADDSGSFRLTPLAECLRSGPGSQRSLAIMMGEEHFRAWAAFHYSVRTGKPAFDHLFGQPIFNYLAAHPESAQVFDEAMTGIHGPETEAMLAAYDFSSVGTLVDVGGGNGSVLRAVLQRYPAMKGVLFDRADVVERAQAALRLAGLEKRCATEPGNFFESIPSGGDAYLMRHIIHDWDDEQALAILRTCRQAMAKPSRLLIVESVIPPGNEPSFAKLLDLNMLVVPGGLERTEAQYRDLLSAAGFTLRRIVPTLMEISIIEGAPR